MALRDEDGGCGIAQHDRDQNGRSGRTGAFGCGDFRFEMGILEVCGGFPDRILEMSAQRRLARAQGGASKVRVADTNLFSRVEAPSHFRIDCARAHTTPTNTC